MASPTLGWLSTTLADRADLDQLGADTISSLASTATQITVVAAYWDERFLASLLTAIPSARRSKATVRVFLNGFTGQRASDDAAALTALAATWRKRGLRRLSFGMVGGWRLFHSKVLVFERAKAVCVLVGSANATEAAFTENEELMLMLRAPNLPKGLRQYLDAVAEVATPIEAVMPYEARTLASFFRGADVYYRPTIVTSFRFDLRLPVAVRTAMTRLQVPIPGITARAGQSYNPFVQVGLTDQEERELAEVLDLDDGQTATGGGRVSLRRYGVQTCYGWWIPGAYRDRLEEQLAPARAKRAGLLNRLAHLLAHVGDALRAQASERFRLLEAFARNQQFTLLESSDGRIKRFDAFLDRTRKRLADRRWRKRAEEPYVQAPVPEMWSDPTSSEEFTATFFDYLEFVAPAKKPPPVWRSIIEQLPSLKGTPSSDEIRSALSAHLARKGWGENDWMDAVTDDA